MNKRIIHKGLAKYKLQFIRNYMLSKLDNMHMNLDKRLFNLINTSMIRNTIHIMGNTIID
jgi:hypothetical protein